MTINAAELLGLENARGVLEKSYYADIIALKNNPLDNIDAIKTVQFVMKEGSCWLQPPRIKHTVLGFSDDLEILEVIIPANYDTINLNEPPKGTPDPAGGAPHAR